ncbi:hypothetical protein K9L27_02060 [Candidatus Gracilibacteria bacterium]|nr:hypothetical protein [Candidatus Gracilibacteria bacterium]
MLKKVLQEIGLDSNEAKAYLSCLKLGTQEVQVIAKETGLSRYDAAIALANLLDRGFVSKFVRGKDFFTPESPNVILKILENNKFELGESIKTFKKILPQFNDYINPEVTQPEISFYEGKEGIVAAYEDTLTSKTDILAIVSIEDTESFFPKYVPNYYQRRKAAGIFIKALFADSTKGRARQKKDKEEFRKSRLLSHKLMKFHIELNIYDDKVSYFSIKESMAIIVRSRVIADSMREVFDLCWKTAEIYEENLSLKKTLKQKN